MELDSDVEFEVSTLMGKAGDSAWAEASAVRLWRLAEVRDPDNAGNQEIPELDDSASSFDFEQEGEWIRLFPRPWTRIYQQ